MLTASSLGKRPITTNNDPPLAWAPENVSIKTHSIESRFVTGPSNILFGGVYVCTFQPGNFTGRGGERVNVDCLNLSFTDVCSFCLSFFSFFPMRSFLVFWFDVMRVSLTSRIEQRSSEFCIVYRPQEKYVWFSIFVTDLLKFCSLCGSCSINLLQAHENFSSGRSFFNAIRNCALKLWYEFHQFLVSVWRLIIDVCVRR